jgi:hypothetical protein
LVDTDVRIQFLVAAHRDPNQLSRLCERLLAAPGAAVTVQWDSARPKPTLARDLDVDLRPTEAPCEWGSGAQLDAMLGSIRALASAPFDWLVVLSGHDYPIRPVQELGPFLEETRYELFFEPEDGPIVADDAAGPLGYLQDRYLYRYHWVPQRWWSRLPVSSRRLVSSGLQRSVHAFSRNGRVRVQRRPGNVFSPGVGMRARSTPFTEARPCRKGSDWFAMSRAAYDDLLRDADVSSELVEYFRHTYCPNEAFFHTALLPRWDAVNAGRNQHYIQFVGERAHPEILQERDWERLVGSGAFFARKFDASDVALLDRIDRDLL